MTPDKYLREVLRDYTVKPVTTARAILLSKELYPPIRLWANRILGTTGTQSSIFETHKNLLKIQTTGSIVKGTNIIGSTDVDLFVSLSYKTPGTLREIYTSLYQYLNLCRLSIRKQDVSIGVNYKGVWIDLVPAKKQSGPTNDHSIYRSKTGKWTKTNVQKHVSLVSKSGRKNEIRALKIWRNLHKLHFPSFYLELTVIEALKGALFGRLDVNLQKVFEYLSGDLKDKRIVDPANSNNIVSEDLNLQEKQEIARTALSSRVKSLQMLWSQIIW